MTTSNRQLMQRIISGIAALSLLLLLCGHAAAKDADRDHRVAQSTWADLELRATLQNLFHFRNDSDFDRTVPAYDEDGQTVGAFATLLTPRVTLRIMDTLRIVYEVELGLNYWSKQNPDQQDPLAADIFVLKHREIYGEGEVLEGRLSFKVGYSRFLDPTGLLLNHWIGVAQLEWSWSEAVRAGAFVGQIPDQSYEGITLSDNNFTRDIWAWGLHTDLRSQAGVHLSAAVTGLHDSHRVDKTRSVVSPVARLILELGPVSGHLDLAFQGGQFEGEGLQGDDQATWAWAVQAHARTELGPVDLRLNLLFLSADDESESNSANYAFLYSGKNESATLMLTEDEIRDWYINFDERMARFEGGMYLGRAGLFVGDAKATWHLHDLFSPSLIVGAATVLQPDNALGGILVGIETDLVVEIKLSDYLLVHLVGGLLVPGQAAAAWINTIDREATDPVGMAEASLTIIY